MQVDFNFNLPHRQQAITRNPPPIRPQQYQHLPRVRHGCHVFCQECFKRIFLGTAAFKLYLLVAWCVGLAGLMMLQKPTTLKEGFFGIHDQSTFTAITTCLLVYLLSQVFGLLAVVTQVEKIFIPYVIILVTVTIASIVVFSMEIGKVVSRLLDFNFGFSEEFQTHLFHALIALCCLSYNSLCLASVVHLCAHFDKKRILALRRRREEIALNARIYSRLVELNNRDQPVTVNVDSPPKYSTLVTKPDALCTPPPGYSQLKGCQNEENVEKTSHRSLFKD